MTTSYKGCNALILGGSCELALVLAETMMQHEIYPILSFRSEEGKERIHSHLEGYDGRYKCFFLDLNTLDAAVLGEVVPNQCVDYMVDFAHSDFERLVASADGADVQQYFQANISNRAIVIQQVARAMLARRSGRMVYVSSAAAEKPNPGQGFYAAAKQACEALYRSVDIELAHRGITAATLRPGYVNAGRGRRYLEEYPDAPFKKDALGRVHKINEVVDTIMYLLSDSARGVDVIR